MSTSVSQRVFTALTYNAIRIVLSVVLSIIYSVVAVRWLQIGKFGGYIFLDSIFSILATIYVLGTHAPLLRFLPEFMVKKDYPRLRRLLSSLQRINLIGACVATLIIILGSDVFFNALGRPELAFYAKLMALSIVPRAVLGITKNFLNALYEQKIISILETFFSALELLLLITFVVFLNLELMGIVTVHLIINSIAALVYYLYAKMKYASLFKGEQIPLGPENVRRVIKYTAPLTALDLANNFLSSAGNIFLGALKNLEDVAYFDIPNSFVNRAFSQAWLMIGSLGTISLTEIRYSNESKFKFAVEQYVKFLLLYNLPITVGGIIFAEPILLTLYGDKVLPSVPIFQILLLAYCPIKVLAISSIILHVREKTYVLLLGDIIKSVIITLLSLWLIPEMGATGAAISAIVSSGILSASYVYIIAVKDHVGNFVPLRTLGKYLISSLLMGTVLEIITYPVRENNLLSITIALTIGPIVYVLVLSFVRAFDQTDKRLFMGSKMPFKSFILRLLWRDKNNPK